MKILFVFADNPKEWNCSQWRCINIVEAINRAGGEDQAQALAFPEFIEKSGKSIELVGWTDVIVLERLMLGNTVPRMLECLALGKVLVGDVDDSYHYMSAACNAYKFWHDGLIVVPDEKGQPRQAKMNIPPIEQLGWGMKILHAITSPSAKLLQDWSAYNTNVVLAPNYILSSAYLPFRRPVSHTPKEREERFIIGWGGSFSHLESWTNSGVIEGLKMVCQKHPNVLIKVAGGDPRVPEAINLPGRVISTGWTPWQEWPKALVEYDLGLIPLSGAYDDRRSWIKALEFTLMGIPWVGSKMIPTEDFADYGTRVKNVPTVWAKAIEAIIENYDAAKAKVDSGMELAMSKDIDKNVPNIIQMYKDIYKKARGE